MSREISEHPAGSLRLGQSESFTQLCDDIATKIADSNYIAPHNANSRTSQLSRRERRAMAAERPLVRTLGILNLKIRAGGCADPVHGLAIDRRVLL